MSRRYIDEHQVLARYLDEQLSDQELAAFEAYWADHPQISEELEAEARLTRGFSHLQASGRLAGVFEGRPPRRAVWPIALAASLLAGVAVTVWLGAARTDSPVMLAASITALNGRDPGPSSPVQSVDLLRVRGSLYDAVIELPATPAVFAMHLLPESVPTSTRYTVGLFAIANDGARTELGTVAGLQPDTDGFLTVYLDASRLDPRQYELRVQGEPSSTSPPPESFLIKIDPTATR